MFDLCHNGWAVVWVFHSLAAKGNPSFAKGATMHDLDEMNYYTIMLILSCEAAMLLSLDWFKRLFTGNPHISWENPWFPADVPLKQS